MSPLSSSLVSKRKRGLDSFDDEPKSCKRPKNDVFMNYSSEDIGKSFISHLKGALDLSGFTISDRTMLPLGQDMGSELLKAIEESEIYVLVFSPDYASSTRCLDELVDVMDCFRKLDHRKVLPVFFKVDPSHVRSQEGVFMEAFQAHMTNIDPNRVQEWRKALKDAGQLCGLTLQIGDEAKFKLEIVEELEKMQRPQELYVTDHPVGIESRADELISTLRLDRKDCVLVVAVFGISGIGKTTIVKEVFNRIAPSFELACFLEDIHYICQVPNWKSGLQNALISCLTPENNKFSNHNDGATKIKRLVHHRKTLLVLDDIAHYQQLQSLGIYPDWFYEGSRIIVTTKDKRSLGNLSCVPYHMKLLNRRESLNLFTRLMFARDDPVNTKFIEEVAGCAGGLPLVLKVWSCHFKQYESEQWPSILETLRAIPHGDIQKQLQLSYDSLSSRSKKLFLDIACFFMHYYTNNKDIVVKVLQDEDSRFFPNTEIQYLVDKFLVEIKDNGLWMHDAIREMGWEIVRQENEDEPGQRTRLWDIRDVIRVLTECSGTESVKSIILTRSEYMSEEVSLEALRKMSNLWLIYFWGSIFSQDDTTHLCFKKLRYMFWNGFPLKSFDNIDMVNIVVLRVQMSKLEMLWEGIKSMKKLRILDVSMSDSLTKTGDFSGLENLEELSFNECRKLKELDCSIGCLKKLVKLDLSRSIHVNRIPWDMIGKLTSLRKLCAGTAYEDAYEDMECLEELEPEEDDDRMLKCLKKCPLIRLELYGYKISKISGSLPRLKHLKLYNQSRFSSHPDSLLQLHGLDSLILYDCQNMKSIPNLPGNITSIRMVSCWSLVNLPCNIFELKSLTFLYIYESPKLGTEDPHFLMKVTGLINLTHLIMIKCSVSQVPNEIGNMVSLKMLNLSHNTFCSLPDTLSNLSQLVSLDIYCCNQLRWLPHLPSNLIYIKADLCPSLDVSSPASIHMKVSKESPCSSMLMQLQLMEEVPDWSSYQSSSEGIISFVAPLENNICGIILWVNNPKGYNIIGCKMYNKTKNKSHCLETEDMIKEMYGDHTFVLRYPLDDTTLSVESGDSVDFELPQGWSDSWGLRLIYESDVVDGILVFLTPTEPIPHIYSDDDYSCSDDEDDQYVDDNSSYDDEDAWLRIVHESGVVDGNLVLPTATEPMPDIPSEMPPGIITQIHDTFDKDEWLIDVVVGNLVIPTAIEPMPNILSEMPPDLTQIHDTYDEDELLHMVYESDVEDGNLAFQTATELVPHISMQTQMQDAITRLSAILNDTQLDAICNDADNDDYWCPGDLFHF